MVWLRQRLAHVFAQSSTYMHSSCACTWLPRCGEDVCAQLLEGIPLLAHTVALVYDYGALKANNMYRGRACLCVHQCYFVSCDATIGVEIEGDQYLGVSTLWSNVEILGLIVPQPHRYLWLAESSRE